MFRGLPWWFSGYDCTSTAGDLGSIPGWGTKIPHAAQLSQKTNKNTYTHTHTHTHTHTRSVGEQQDLYRLNPRLGTGVSLRSGLVRPRVDFSERSP